MDSASTGGVGDLGMHKSTLVAKAIIVAFYKQSDKFNYIMGLQRRP
ncbi:hypothetical protein ACFVKB_21495 [Rhodococcus sp. NPDC127530]